MNGNGKRKIARCITNFCPLCRGPIDYAHVLEISEPLRRWEVRCQDGAWVHFKSDKDGKDHLVFMANVAAPGIQRELF